MSHYRIGFGADPEIVEEEETLSQRVAALGEHLTCPHCGDTLWNGIFHKCPEMTNKKD